MKSILKTAAIITALLLVLTAFAGCGKKQPSDTENTASADTDGASAPASSEKTDDSSAADTDSGNSGEIDPYAWLGLEDMPKCAYLDIISGNRYVQVVDYYVLSVSTEQTEAVDGINTYTGTSTSRSYSIDGMVYSVNESSKSYMEYDMTSSAQLSKSTIENAMANGLNIKAREFSTTGKGTIPLYSNNGDSAEYDYYEYVTDSSNGSTSNKLTERFYMKDGDVFAIYQNSELGTVSTESVKVIKSVSADIPENMLTVPDLTGYEKLN